MNLIEREREREREDTWRDWIGEERRGSSSNASEGSSQQTLLSIKKIYVIPCVYAPWLALSFHGFLFEPEWGGFQGFRFGVREKGFSSKLVANLVLHPKRQVCQLRESK
jgi:hypothetical protein